MLRLDRPAPFLPIRLPTIRILAHDVPKPLPRAGHLPHHLGPLIP